MRKRILSFLLALSMLFALVPDTASAEEMVQLEDFHFSGVNPLYADTITEADLVPSDNLAPRADNTGSGSYYDARTAGEMIRDDLVARDTTISVNLTFPYNSDTIRQDAEDQIFAVLSSAMTHTGNPVEGDYLLWQFAGLNVDTSNATIDNAGQNVHITVTYTMTYHSSAEQEAEMDTAVSQLLEELNVFNADSYTKLKTVYDYITANVTYDQENANSSDTLKNTAYAALIKKTAVCRGFSALLYRLALELGVDCRMIPGDSKGQPHVWNIAKVGDLYYNLDATWDAGLPQYQCFLIGSEEFADHDRWDKPGDLPTEENYNSEAFHIAYPMSESSYSAEPPTEDTDTSGSCGENVTWALTEDGVLILSGSGTMSNYSADGAPWYQNRASIQSVLMEAGISTIGAYAFYDCSNLSEIVIPGSVNGIGDSSFEGCDCLEDVYYAGTSDTWASLDNTPTATYIHYECAEPDNHWQTRNVEPTCEEAGYTAYSCACGYGYAEDGSPALGHSWDAGTVTKEPTEAEPGIRTYTCKVCQDTKTEEIIYTAPETPETEVTRLSGSGRVETAIAVADKLKEVLQVERFDTIVIANGDNFADALPGSYLASQMEAPILLCRNSGKGDALNEDYIQENLTASGTVYLLGGTASIPESIQESLTSLGYHVIRLAGSNRYETNLKILEEVGVAPGGEILITTGWEYADSLSASATGLPILMLNSRTEELTADQITFLETYAENDFTIIGGNKSISEKLKADIEDIVGEVGRLCGEGREETSATIAAAYREKAECVLIAFSRNFPDGLCGGPLAYALKAPLLLINTNKESAAADYVAENSVSRAYILGGTNSVSDASIQAVFRTNLK